MVAAEIIGGIFFSLERTKTKLIVRREKSGLQRRTEIFAYRCDNATSDSPYSESSKKKIKKKINIAGRTLRSELGCKRPILIQRPTEVPSVLD